MLRQRGPISRTSREFLEEDYHDEVYRSVDNNIVEASVVYVDSSGFIARAQANASSTMHGIGLAVHPIPSGFVGRVRTRGPLTSDNLDFSGFIGRNAYVSAAAAGAVSTTPPTASGQIVQQIGFMRGRRTISVSIGGAFQRGGSLN